MILIPDRLKADGWKLTAIIPSPFALFFNPSANLPINLPGNYAFPGTSPGFLRHDKEVSLISAINSGLSGLAVHSAMVANAAGNLANLNTTSYKGSRLSLGTLPSMSQGGSEVGQGAQILATSRDFSSGPLLSTGSEGSNVDPAREMIDLMLGQRGFQASIKVLQTAGEMLGSVLDIRA